MPNKQKLEGEEKVRIILEYLDGKIGLREGARKAGVAHPTFRCWIGTMKIKGRKVLRRSISSNIVLRQKLRPSEPTSEETEA